MTTLEHLAAENAQLRAQLRVYSGHIEIASWNAAVTHIHELLDEKTAWNIERADLTERLRVMEAQCAALYLAASAAYVGWREGNDVVGPMQKLRAVLDSDVKDAALLERVRVQEEALRRALLAMDACGELSTDMMIARQAVRAALAKGGG